MSREPGVQWNCPHCPATAYDTADDLAFIAAGHKCGPREIGPEEAKIRAQTRVGLMGIRPNL